MNQIALEDNTKQISIDEAIALYKNPEHEKRILLIELNENKRRIQHAKSMLCLKLDCDKNPILTICNELLCKIWNCNPDESSCSGHCYVFDALSRAKELAERMRVRTITEDEGTWPEEGIDLLFCDEGDYYVDTLKYSGKCWINSEGYTVYIIGHTWQYLPDWSE